MTQITAPLAPDLYTRNMAPLFDQQQLAPVPVGYQAFFGRSGSETIYSPHANTIDMDLIQANRKTSKLVMRGEITRLLGPSQKNLTRGNHTSKSRIYPLSIEEGGIAASQKNDRIPGEAMQNSGVTSQMRFRYWSMKEHYEQVRRQVAMFERLASQSCFEGKQDAIIGTTNPDLQYDFDRNTDNSITLGTQWTDVSGSSPVGDLDDACRIFQVNSFRKAEFAVFATNVLEAYLKTDEIRNYSDNRRYEISRVSMNNPVPEKFKFMVDAGFTAWGMITTYRGVRLWIFTYDALWEEDNGTVYDYTPAGKVLIGSTVARCDRWFGPSETFDDVPARERFYREMFGFDPRSAPMPMNIKKPSVIDRRMFYFDAYPNEDWSVITTRTQSAPIFATNESNAWVVIENAA